MTYYGIYKITNLTNGKMYIGKHMTNDLDDGYMGSGLILRRAIKKYGVESFRKEWLMFCEDEEELNYMERVYVDQTWVDRSDTYNIAIGGQGGGINKGKKYSSEARKRMSDAQKKSFADGRVPNMLGKHHTDETRQKISDAHKGITPWNKGQRGIYTEQQLEKMREGSKGKTTGASNGMFGVHRCGAANPNFGHKWTDEQKKRLSEKLKARKQRRNV